MNPQLIYVSTDPRAIAWAELAAAHNRDVTETWNQFVTDVTVLFPVEHGTRGVAVVDRSIIGLRRAYDGEDILGWDWAPGVEALVPNNSDEGRPWQKRIDALPVDGDVPAVSTIGMVEKAVLQQPDGTATVFQGTIAVGTEGGIAFALWPVREIKDAMDAKIQQLFLATGVRWTEMPRSAWYTRVEASEAEATAGRAG